MEDFASLFGADTLAAIDDACSECPHSIVETALPHVPHELVYRFLHATELRGANSMALASPVMSMAFMAPALKDILLEHLAARIGDDGPALHKFVNIIPIILFRASNMSYDCDAAWAELDALSNDVFAWVRAAYESTFEEHYISSDVFDILGHIMAEMVVV